MDISKLIDFRPCTSDIPPYTKSKKQDVALVVAF